MTMSASLVSQRVVARKATTARRARDVRVRLSPRVASALLGSLSVRRALRTVAPRSPRASSYPQVLAAAKQSKPKVIGKAAELRLIGKAVTAAEELGLLGIADSVSLSQIEKAGLLSKGEALIYDRGAPGTILALGFALAAAGSAAVYAIPDDSAALIAAQAVVGGVSVVGFGAALTGSNLLRKLQAD